MMKNMKTKTFTIILLTALTGILCTGCSSDAVPEASVAAQIEGETENSILEEQIGTKEDLSGGRLTVPSYLQGDETDGLQKAEDSASEGDVASITYDLSGDEQEQLISQAKQQLLDSIAEVLSDKKYYPHITKISVSENCQTFDVTFSEAQPNSYELALRMAFYLSGDKYQLYAGTPASEILTTVNYVDAATGEIFAAGNSGEMNH